MATLSPERGAAGARARDWRIGLLVGLAGLVLILLADALVKDEGTPHGDDQIYELMAQHPFATHTFPFAYRFFVPTLVHVLPFGHTFSFSLLAWLSTAACGTVAFVLMRRFDVPVWLAAALALCLVVSPHLLIASLRQGRNVDPESVLVMLAGGLAVADRRPLALGIIVAVGSLVRESALFLVPFAYAVWAARPVDREVARQVLVATLPGVLLYAGVRVGVPTLGNDLPNPLHQAASDPGPTFRRLATAFGPLWLVAPFALRDLPYARRGLVLVACCLVGFLFAGDWGRVILLAAPVFYVAAGHVLIGRPRAAFATVAAFAALDVVYAVYMQVHGVESGIVGGPLPTYPVR
jgi:hypothetical protein